MLSRNMYHFTWVSLTLDKGYLLTAAPPDLEWGIALLGPPAPMQLLLLGRGKCHFHSNPKERMLKLLHNCTHLTR